MKLTIKSLKEEVQKILDEVSADIVDDVPGATRGENLSQDEILFEYINEVQTMALRLMAIDKELREKKEAGEINYFPGYQFKLAAKMLTSRDYADNSIVNSLAKWISNELFLKRAEKAAGLDQPTKQLTEPDK